jgi:hypothetical protein
MIERLSLKHQSREATHRSVFLPWVVGQFRETIPFAELYSI